MTKLMNKIWIGNMRRGAHRRRMGKWRRGTLTSVVLAVRDDVFRRYLDPELQAASSRQFKYLPLFACHDDKGE